LTPSLLDLSEGEIIHFHQFQTASTELLPT